MSASVKRRYNSAARRQAAEGRQTRTLQAASRLFAEHGYSATTMEAIAEAAHSSVESVYLAFKSKAALLARVVDVALAGDEAPVALADRPMFQQVRNEHDQRRQVALVARNARVVLERSGPLQWRLIMASSHDPDVADLVERYQQRRLEVQTEFVRWIAANGSLAPGVSIERGGHLIWTLVSPELHHMLREVLAYSPEEYEAWLGRMLQVALLPPHRK
jgi:AcrR family transcriptional regulator